MGRITIISLLVYGFVGVVSSDRIWDGPCGEWADRLTHGQRGIMMGFYQAGHLDVYNAREVARRIPMMDPNNARDLMVTNPWQIIVISPDNEVVEGSATLFRVRRGSNESDMAITEPDTCRKLTQRIRSRRGLKARFANDPSLDVPITDCWKHPEYDLADQGGELALLKLAHPVSLTGPVQAVCLPDHRETITWTEGISGAVVGLGHRDSDFSIGFLSHHLRRSDLQMSPSRCTGTFHFDGSSALFCADAVDQNDVGRFGEVTGDLPFFTNDPDHPTVLLGLARWFFPLDPRLPAVFLRLSAYLGPNDWFEQTIRTKSNLWN